MIPTPDSVASLELTPSILNENRFPGLAQIDSSSLNFPLGGNESSLRSVLDIHDSNERESQQRGKPKCEEYTSDSLSVSLAAMVPISVSSSAASSSSLPIVAPSSEQIFGESFFEGEFEVLPGLSQVNPLAGYAVASEIPDSDEFIDLDCVYEESLDDAQIKRAKGIIEHREVRSDGKSDPVMLEFKGLEKRCLQEMKLLQENIQKDPDSYALLIAWPLGHMRVLRKDFEIKFTLNTEDVVLSILSSLDIIITEIEKKPPSNRVEHDVIIERLVKILQQAQKSCGEKVQYRSRELSNEPNGMGGCSLLPQSSLSSDRLGFVTLPPPPRRSQQQTTISTDVNRGRPLFFHLPPPPPSREKKHVNSSAAISSSISPSKSSP